jgi:glycerol-3-phosphate acyltransferase PlsY
MVVRGSGAAVTLEGMLWVVGGYVVGSLPTTYLVSRARRGTAVVRAARRDASEADAHMLITRHLGGGWSALAATGDVAKGLVYPLVARRFGGLVPGWVAVVGVVLVIGHVWPPYARAMAGRGLSAAAGVLLALLPVQMVVAGVIILLGIATRFFSDVVYTGPASTVGLASVPGVAAIQGQPAEYVAMGAAIFVVVVARRLEGMGAMVAGGMSRWAALYYRAVWDVSAPPRRAAGPEGHRAAP